MADVVIRVRPDPDGWTWAALEPEEGKDTFVQHAIGQGLGSKQEAIDAALEQYPDAEVDAE